MEQTSSWKANQKIYLIF